MSDKPTVKGRLLALLVGVVVTVLVAEGVLRIAMPQWREFYSGRFMRMVVVPSHGVVTTGRPGFDGYFAQNNGDFRVRITINDFGLRNPEPVEAADGRIWIVGDSMAFGWGVEQDEMYSSVIGRTSNLPTYNVAAPGRDVCGYQALLTRMPENLKPYAVVLGLVLENDVRPYDCRATARQQEQKAASGAGDRIELGSWSQFKGFLTRYSALYNFVAVALKRVDVVRQVLTAIGVISEGHAYKRHITDDEFDTAVESTAEEIVTLRAMLPEQTPFAILIVPGRFEVKNGDPFYRKLRTEMGQALRSRGIAFIDPFERFKAAGFGPTHFVHDGHWSPLGHRLAGETAALWLKSRLSPN